MYLLCLYQNTVWPLDKEEVKQKLKETNYKLKCYLVEANVRQKDRKGGKVSKVSSFLCGRQLPSPVVSHSKSRIRVR